MGKFDRRMRRSAACAVLHSDLQTLRGAANPARAELTRTAPAGTDGVHAKLASSGHTSGALAGADLARAAAGRAKCSSGNKRGRRAGLRAAAQAHYGSAAQLPLSDRRRKRAQGDHAEKLVTATEDNYDYTSLFFAVFIAADSFATKSTPEFHQGAAGFARYYWHTVADQSVENYFVELIVPAVTHEDSRYYAMGREGGSFWKRAGYSLTAG